MVQTARRSFVFLQFIDKVFDDPVVLVVRVHRCRRGEDSRAPTVALVEKFVDWGSSSIVPQWHSQQPAWQGKAGTWKCHSWHGVLSN